MISITFVSFVQPLSLPAAHHLRGDKPCIPRCSRVDNIKPVIHTYAPFAPTPAESDHQHIVRTLTRFACLTILIKSFTSRRFAATY